MKEPFSVDFPELPEQKKKRRVCFLPVFRDNLFIYLVAIGAGVCSFSSVRLARLVHYWCYAGSIVTLIGNCLAFAFQKRYDTHVFTS